MSSKSNDPHEMNVQIIFSPAGEEWLSFLNPTSMRCVVH